MSPGRAPLPFFAAALVLSAAYVAALCAQRTDVFVASRDHSAINYTKGPTDNRVDALNRGIEDGRIHLTFDQATGYLRSTLDALGVPVESQVAVFAQNSFQAPHISMTNPRVLYFNDAVAVGYVRGGELLEVATHDPRQGVVFYTLDQKRGEPQFKRSETCLACHLSWTTLGVPGLFVLSTQTVPEDKNAYASGFTSDHRAPFSDRWGGWYLTGHLGSIRHLGNRPVSTASTTADLRPEALELKSLDSQFDTAGYLTGRSDVVALMALEHQTHATNLITRLGWEARLAAAETPTNDARVREAAADLVDYFLFVDEAPLPDKVEGTSGFAEKFTARGPVDKTGRTLRQLDLGRRLMRYPCSYMIYSDAFEALPASAKTLAYQRFWQVLSGKDTNRRYARLSATDLRDVIDILRDTKKDLPEYFH